MATDDATWTEDAIARLRALWGEGHSTAEIGRRLGASKNAVIGKAPRLRLPPRPSPIRRGEGAVREPGPTSEPTPAAAPETTAPAPVPPGAPVRAAAAPAPAASAPGLTPRDLPARVEPVRAEPPSSAPAAPRRPVPSRRCCWPIGEPGRAGFRFCDAEADAGKPYCPEHRALAYAKAPRPRAGDDAA